MSGRKFAGVPNLCSPTGNTAELRHHRRIDRFEIGDRRFDICEANLQRLDEIRVSAQQAGSARDLVLRRLGPAGVLSQVSWIYGWQPPTR